GVMALSLLFGGAGAYVLVTGTRAPGFGPADLGAGEAAEGIAVVPFSVTGGADLDLWREGMVDVLSANLDGVAGFRTIDARTVMARWRDKVPGDDAPELRTALEVAAETGARYGLVGNLVGSPAGIRIGVDLYDLDTGEKVTQVVQEGAADQVLELTGELSVALARDLLAASGQEVVQSMRLGALTTTSLPALRSYIEGQAAFRHADFATATAAFERAVEQDSLFALAWFSLSDAYGWLEDISSQTAARTSDRAVALMDRLPPRERILVQAGQAAYHSDPSFYGTLREAALRYPDDADIWYNFGDYIYHVAMPVGLATVEQAADAFERAIALDPGFAPYQVHLVEFAIERGDRADAEARLAFYVEATNDERRIDELSLAIPLILGDSAEFAAVLETARLIDLGTLQKVRLRYTNTVDRYDRLRELMWVNRNRAGASDAGILYSLITEGALRRSDRLLDSLDVAVAVKGIAVGFTLGLWSTASDLPHMSLAKASTCEEPEVSTACQMFMAWGLARSGDLSGAAESARVLRRRAGEVGQDQADVMARRLTLVDGTLALVRGQTAEARKLLVPLTRGTGNEANMARVNMGDLERSAGNLAEAIRYYEGALGSYNRGQVTLALARIHDSRGETEEALRLYRSFLTITRVGDQDLPEVMEAREALARLGG
ncbi:MAG TPA: tetratricopeptide repeat protein, partial [Longimicrobiales bacterium]|nr:tetratricopeptide repeat protein [Longimicrobiales bacterium]